MLIMKRNTNLDPPAARHRRSRNLDLSRLDARSLEDDLERTYSRIRLYELHLFELKISDSARFTLQRCVFYGSLCVQTLPEIILMELNARGKVEERLIAT